MVGEEAKVIFIVSDLLHPIASVTFTQCVPKLPIEIV